MKKKFRIVSVLLTVVLLMSALATLVSAGLGNDKGQEQGQDRQGAQQFSAIGAEVRVAAGQPPIRKFQDTSETITISPDKIFWDEKNDPYAVRITWELMRLKSNPVRFLQKALARYR